MAHSQGRVPWLDARARLSGRSDGPVSVCGDDA